jgi:ABC-type transporter Mla subunit MlaD
MLYVAIALGLVGCMAAFLAWDVARREIRRRAAASQASDHGPELEALKADVATLTARTKTQEDALINALQEMRALLAPVRRAVLNAVPDNPAKQRKEG